MIRALITCALLASSLPAAADTTGALGVAAGWQRRRDYGADTHWALVPELVGQAYLRTPAQRLYLRPGVRFGYGGLDRAEMPAAVRMVERDLTASAEVALLRDGVVIPTVALGAAVTHRWTRLETRAPVTASPGALDSRETLPSLYLQLGLGLPLADGRLVAEPHLRYERVFGDDRLGWRLGVDFTVSVF